MKVVWWRRRSREGLCKPRQWLPKSWGRIILHVDRFERFELCFSPKTGISLRSHGQWGHKGGKACVFYPAVEVLVKKRSVSKEAGKVSQHLVPMETDFFGRLMKLVEHVGMTAYDDGDPRKPGWWTLRTIGAAYQIEVKDPDTCARLVVTGATLDDVLMLADTLLGSEEAPWEPDPWLTAAAKKGKK